MFRALSPGYSFKHFWDMTLLVILSIQVQGPIGNFQVFRLAALLAFFSIQPRSPTGDLQVFRLMALMAILSIQARGLIVISSIQACEPTSNSEYLGSWPY